jgi:hypothetical protein
MKKKIYILIAALTILYILFTLFLAFSGELFHLNRTHERIVNSPKITIATHISSEDERITEFVHKVLVDVLDNKFYVEINEEVDELAHEDFTSIEFFLSDPSICKDIDIEELDQQISFAIDDSGVTQEVKYYSGSIRNMASYPIKYCVYYANQNKPLYLIERVLSNFTYYLLWPILSLLATH